MSLINNATANTDKADLIILSIVETIRDQEQTASASAVASLIGGAPVAYISDRMAHLSRLGLIEGSFDGDVSWQLTELGSEFLRRELVGWSPSKREENRRTLELRAVRDGLFRSRLR